MHEMSGAADVGHLLMILMLVIKVSRYSDSEFHG